MFGQQRRRGAGSCRTGYDLSICSNFDLQLWLLVWTHLVYSNGPCRTGCGLSMLLLLL
jgi:hypothetical protein